MTPLPQRRLVHHEICWKVTSRPVPAKAAIVSAAAWEVDVVQARQLLAPALRPGGEDLTTRQCNQVV